jgi:DNA-binding transcriptional LysR family regulator
MVDKSHFLAISLPFGYAARIIQMLSPIERFFASTLKLSHLRLLVTLSELRQVTKVAEAFHVTQPAVSKQLAEIEQALQTAITQRVGNAIQLTDVGMALARRGKDILRQVDLAQRDVTALVAGTAGHVTLSAVTAVPQAFVSQAVMSFLTRAPAASLTFIESTIDRLHAMLHTGTVDLVIGRAKLKDHPEIVQEELYSEPFVFVAGATHALATAGPVTLEMVRTFPWLVPQKNTPSFNALAAFMEEQGMDIKDACVESSSISVNVDLMTRGPFVSILPLSYAREHAARGHLCFISTPPLEQISEVILHRRVDLENPAALLIAECIREEAARRRQHIAPDGKNEVSTINP